MDEKKTNSSYQQLYSELMKYALSTHERNKRRIKYGTIVLLLFPVVLLFIRWITDSDKVVFLLVWVIGLILIAFYLIGVEYLDASIQKKLNEMISRETEPDGIRDTEIYKKYRREMDSGLIRRSNLSKKVEEKIEDRRDHDKEMEPEAAAEAVQEPGPEGPGRAADVTGKEGDGI